MIIDSHCHTWLYWPYQPPVPDPESRGRIEQLLNEMDLHGVDQALIVCAQIENNPENNIYVAEQVTQHPERLHQLADLDSSWSSHYHTPGAAQRLRNLAKNFPLCGFTHYLHKEDDGNWLFSEEGLALFQAAADLRLIASLSCYPHQQAAIRKVAERFPQVPVLCHHLGHIRMGHSNVEENLQQTLDSARVPNIYIKLSGYAYNTSARWEYPYSDVQWMVRALYEHFGPFRMCWGSDYPVVRFYMTYQQSLEAFRTHATFISAGDKDWILGKTLERLLANPSL